MTALSKAKFIVRLPLNEWMGWIQLQFEFNKMNKTNLKAGIALFLTVCVFVRLVPMENLSPKSLNNILRIDRLRALCVFEWNFTEKKYIFQYLWRVFFILKETENFRNSCKPQPTTKIICISDKIECGWKSTSQSQFVAYFQLAVRKKKQ